MEPLVIEQTYPAPVHKVWEALTSKDKMKQWYFDLAAFEPKVGFEFQFEGQNEGHSFTHLCKVTEVEPEKKLTYSWRYKGYEGISFVTFELFNEGSSTRVKLTHAGLESFPDDPNFARKNFEFGWTSLMGTMLKEYLAK